MGGEGGARSIEDMLRNPVMLARNCWERWGKEIMSGAKQVSRPGIFATRPVQQSTTPQALEQNLVEEAGDGKFPERRKGSRGGVESYMGQRVKEEYVKHEEQGAQADHLEVERLRSAAEVRYLAPANPPGASRFRGLD